MNMQKWRCWGALNFVILNNEGGHVYVIWKVFIQQWLDFPIPSIRFVLVIIWMWFYGCISRRGLTERPAHLPILMPSISPYRKRNIS